MTKKLSITLGGMVLLNVINLGLTGFWAFDGAIMPLYLTSKFGLSNSTIGLILGIGKFMIVLSMFFGLFSDLTQMKWGKRRPLMLLGGLISAPLIALLPHMTALPLLIAILTICYFGIQLAAVPYFSLVPEVVPNEKLGTANAFFSIFGGVGTLLAYAFILSVVYKSNKNMAFYVIAVLHLIGTLVSVFAVKEHLPEPKKVDKTKIMLSSISEIIADIPKYPSIFKFLLSNLFFWLGLGAFVVFFTKFMEYYVNIPGEIAGYVLGTVVGVSILLAVPVGLLGDKINRKTMTSVGMLIVFVGLLLGYILIGPSSTVSGLDLADSTVVAKIAALNGFDTSAADLTVFANEEFDPPADVNNDEMNDKKSDILRWCLNGTLVDDKESGDLACRKAVSVLLGENADTLDSTAGVLGDLGKVIQAQTKKVLIISFGIIAIAAIGLTICFVIMATILPTLMPDGKMGLYMGFYSTVTGLGQLISLTLAGIIIDATINNSALGYRWIFIQGSAFMLVAILALKKVPYIPTATQPTISDMERKNGKPGEVAVK